MECLHTVLLGAYKYLFHDLMSQITSTQKSEIAANIDAFPLSGMHFLYSMLDYNAVLYSSFKSTVYTRKFKHAICGNFLLARRLAPSMFAVELIG